MWWEFQKSVDGIAPKSTKWGYLIIRICEYTPTFAMAWSSHLSLRMQKSIRLLHTEDKATLWANFLTIYSTGKIFLKKNKKNGCIWSIINVCRAVGMAHSEQRHQWNLIFSSFYFSASEETVKHQRVVVWRWTQPHHSEKV